jgi:hypothetical protein
MTYFEEIKPIIEKYRIEELTGISVIKDGLEEIKQVGDFISKTTGIQITN